MSLLSKLKRGLAKTKTGFIGKLEQAFTLHNSIDEDFYDEIEEIMLSGDVSVDIVMDLMDDLRATVRHRGLKEPQALLEHLQDGLGRYMPQEEHLQVQKGRLNIILIVGVNGVGKTTTIGKLAYHLKEDGFKVLLAAGDTFRAAASEQLTIWAQRVGVGIVKHEPGADPSAVVYDAIHASRSRGIDVLIIDTAGRLHTKKNLMNELSKIRRIIAREVEDAPQETLLVVDATTGQNGLFQAKAFKEATDITGLILTKLDGTAKGGIVFGIAKEYQVPVKYIGIGEQLDDLQPFTVSEFINALFDKDMSSNNA